MRRIFTIFCLILFFFILHFYESHFADSKSEFNSGKAYAKDLFAVYPVAVYPELGFSGRIKIAQYNRQEDISWKSLGGIWSFTGNLLYGEGASGFNKAYYTDQNFSDFVYEVRLRKISSNDGPIGLLARYSEDRDEGYLLLIWPHGGFQFSRLVGQTRHAVGGGAPAILNKGDQWNRLRIIGRGQQLGIFINGVEQISFIDNHYSFGRLGLVIHGGPAQKAEFKILSMSSL